jgi:hypothetical protein
MRISYFVVIALTSFIPFSSYAQSLLGSSVTVVGRYPNITNAVTVPATATVGPGVEFNHLDLPNGLSVPVVFDIGANVINLGFGYSYSGTNTLFDGDEFTFASLSGVITGVAANPNSSPNYNQIIVGWSGSGITFNFAQMAGFAPGANFRFDVSVSPVPEPASLKLTIFGLVALGARRFLKTPALR